MPSASQPSTHSEISNEDRMKLLDLFKEKDLPRGTRLAEKLAKTHPHSFTLMMTLGMAYELQGKTEKSIKKFEDALALDPASIDLRGKLAHLYLTAGRHADVDRLLKKDVALDDLDDEMLAILSTSAFEREAHEECLLYLERIKQHTPERVDAHISIGQCLVALERFKSGISAFEDALKLEPDSVVTLIALGEVLVQLHKPGEALPHLEKAHQLDPENHDAILHMAAALKDTFRLDEAIALLEDAVQKFPEKTNCRVTLADFYSIMGRSDAARDQFLLAMEHDEDSLHVLIKLSQFTDLDRIDEIRSKIEKIYRKSPQYTRDVKHKIVAGYALGRLYANQGNAGKAFRTYKTAGALQKDLLDYSFDKSEQQFQEIRDEFRHITPEHYAANAESGDKDIVFIIGMPRSGTSLTEQILSSHSQIHGAGELNFMNEETGELMHLLPKHPDVHLERKVFESIRKAYLGHLESINTEKPIITDKMPHNFLRLGFILCAFPEAKIIHLNRDPAAVCWSCFMRFFPARGMAFTYDLEDLGRYYRLYLDLMDYWREKFPGRIYELDYVTLTEAQEEESRRMLDYCGLEWEDACLEFWRNDRGVMTASQEQVRQKIYQGSSEAWKEYAPHLKPLLKALKASGVDFKE